MLTRRTARTTIGALAALAGLASAAAAETRLGWIEISGAIAEQPSPFAWLLGPEAPTTLRTLTERIRGAADDDAVDGLVIRFKDAAPNLAQIEELGEAIGEVRAAGKDVVFFAENYGGAELMAGVHADHSIIQSGGAVMWTGIHAEEMYLADMLSWIGVEPQFLQVGDYKGASEMWARSEPSQYWDQNIDGLLDALWDHQREMIGDHRDLSEKELDKALEELWLAGGDQAVELGLIDAAVDFAEIETHLADHFDDKIKVLSDYAEESGSELDFSNPFAMLNILSTTPKHSPKRDTIAIMHINGAIVDGDSAPASPFGGGASVGSRTARNALEAIRGEDLIKGVVVRIDSPGGSAIASEVIWQGLRRVAEEKPVWVSVGSMAASGGYYIAVGGDRIYANDASIVGSIGVVGGKFSLGGMYDKLKIRVTERSRGPIAGVFSSASTWTSAERELVGRRMAETYELFTERVEQGRRRIDLDKVAEGRLFTGDDAKRLRMIDEVGTLEEAITDLASELELRRFDVMEYPGPQGFEDFFGSILGGAVQAPGVAAGGSMTQELAAMAEQLMGTSAWNSLRDSANALWQMRHEPVLLTSPRVLIIR
ncbi:MAG: signal peptide peptidase SppA [Planctomycetota bacterium]